MNRPPPDQPRLSPRAAAQRDALLESLRPIVERRGQRRRLRRRAFGAALLLLALAGTWWFSRPTPQQASPPSRLAANTTPPAPISPPAPALTSPPATPPRVAIAIIKNDPSILARCTVRSGADVPIATDAELQAALIATGQRPGLIKTRGSVLLASQFKK
ncbi:MAG: hypothetical protein GC200_10010 [Tepidisphaera sp.]|nr:hypothetical protein [Tepidisphaera sp.]